MEAQTQTERDRALEAVPDYVHERHAEFLYRSRVVPGMTHEQYLDEPGDVIEWNTRLWRAYDERDKRQQAAAQQQ